MRRNSLSLCGGAKRQEKEKIKEDVFLLLGIFIFTYYESAEEQFYQYISGMRT